MRPHWKPAYVALGSNLDQPKHQVTEAMHALATLPKTRLVQCSSLYRTQPIGPSGQPEYINAVAAVLTQLAPHALLDELQAIELAQGRTRAGERWGPRILDLDILMYADECIDDERLTVPHRELHKRDFVLGPWLELSPDVMIPARGRVGALAAALDMGNLAILKN